MLIVALEVVAGLFLLVAISFMVRAFAQALTSKKFWARTFMLLAGLVLLGAVGCSKATPAERAMTLKASIEADKAAKEKQIRILETAKMKDEAALKDLAGVKLEAPKK
jgi:hypothetical protein